MFASIINNLILNDMNDKVFTTIFLENLEKSYNKNTNIKEFYKDVKDDYLIHTGEIIMLYDVALTPKSSRLRKVIDKIKRMFN